MSNLYGVEDELPEDIADPVLEDEKPVGPPADPDTASVDGEE